MSEARGAGCGMDVFRVRDRLIDDYREFTGSFVDIHDKNIREHVAERMASGYQWPDPWLSLNPNFASGGTITELVSAGLLHTNCERIFRLRGDDSNDDGPPLQLHCHQREAVEIARGGNNYLLTNYVMLDLVPTRPRDRGLIEAARGLQFLVLDELHTYRGRQGADVALLTRRLREACGGPSVQCVGTSATMTTEGEAADQRHVV